MGLRPGALLSPRDSLNSSTPDPQPLDECLGLDTFVFGGRKGEKDNPEAAPWSWHCLLHACFVQPA